MEEEALQRITLGEGGEEVGILLEGDADRMTVPRLQPVNQMHFNRVGPYTCLGDEEYHDRTLRRACDSKGADRETRLRIQELGLRGLAAISAIAHNRDDLATLQTEYHLQDASGSVGRQDHGKAAIITTQMLANFCGLRLIHQQRD